MLRATVGLSRKLSRDYNSNGYSVNLEGEIPFSVDDPVAVTEKIKELFSLAQEALSQEIERDRGDDASGRRDENRSIANPQAAGTGPVERVNDPSAPRSSPNDENGTKSGPNGNDGSATNKQVQFLLTMSKRLKLSTPQLENRVAEIIGRRCSVYHLTKKEAGLVLDQFTKDATGSSNGNGSQGR